MATSQNSLNAKHILKVGNKSYTYYCIQTAGKALKQDISRLPYSHKVLLENLLRFEDNRSVFPDDIKALASGKSGSSEEHEIAFRPARVLMQDFTGVPAVVDLAAMRDAMKDLGGDPKKINPLAPVDLVIDHSVMVDYFGDAQSFQQNVDLEMERNRERYEFLKWGQKAFDNFRVVPPGTGICHQVNLEYLAKVVWTNEVDGETVAYPDTLVGTDSHTTMINGLAVLGWGVGGIEAEAAMLGQPISMLIPDVVGFKLTGKLKEGTTATDLVLTVTQMLRKKGVVGKFVEFYGHGLDDLPLADRATIANMAPEYGATCGFFPIDKETIKYLELSGRDQDTIALVEAYAKAQGMWRDKQSADPIFTETLELNLSEVEPSLAGPKRPQDRILLSEAKQGFVLELQQLMSSSNDTRGKVVPTPGVDFLEDKDHLATTLSGVNTSQATGKEHIHCRGANREEFDLEHGDVVIAAITSCTNTSNPNVMIAAGLVAKKAHELGINVKPWVKTSLAPGSKVVTEYLDKAGLTPHLNALGFNLVGYGCTTCIGNSGPLDQAIEKAIKDNGLVVSSVLSGNRNFEGRVHPLTKANYLASPPLVVAYALAGSMKIDITKEPIGGTGAGRDVYLKDVWPSNQEIADAVSKTVTPDMFKKRYADVFSGDAAWQEVPVSGGLTYTWSDSSTYIKKPPYFAGMKRELPHLEDIKNAAILALLGDSITTDHISPAGNIAKESPAANYLRERHIEAKDFNSYGSRRGNDEVMTRGTFANIRIKNEMVTGKEGGITTYIPTGEVMSIYDAAIKYRASKTPLVVIAGKEYGTGSSRDWAAKGTNLLGIRAVIAESFERIHRSNLVGMGVLPLQFPTGITRKSLSLQGDEHITITGIQGHLKPKQMVECIIERKNGVNETIKLLCRIDTADEIDYFYNGGILHNVLREIAGLHGKKAA